MRTFFSLLCSLALLPCFSQSINLDSCVTKMNMKLVKERTMNNYHHLVHLRRSGCAPDSSDFFYDCTDSIPGRGVLLNENGRGMYRSTICSHRKERLTKFFLIRVRGSSAIRQYYFKTRTWHTWPKRAYVTGESNGTERPPTK